jgi:5-enolpyruvylshikimate-3-phosphate synthase
MLDLGNSGTAARLLTGLLASHRFTSFMTGDASLRSRPMQRVAEPLSRMGATFISREGGRMPLAIVRQRRTGADRVSPAGRLGPGQKRLSCWPA